MTSSYEPCEKDIVVVDDDDDALQATNDLLGLLGYETCAYNSPERALEVLRVSGRPRVLLTDVVMPKMNGVELATAARQVVPGLCVIYMTGYPAGLLLGAGIPVDDVLLKPWSVDAMQKKIDDCLKHP
jgi:DNA-binding NtrC family response regulator